MKSDLTIVIPAGPGDTAWSSLLPQLASAKALEIILVVGHGVVIDHLSADTRIRVLHSETGRAKQLNAGVDTSRGDWLWFLHADSQVSTRTLGAAQRFIESDAAAIGYFDLRFLDDGPRMMFINSGGAALRSRLFGLPFGDQGLLMPRRVFDVLGGFDDIVEKGEDHALIWAAHAKAIPVRALGATIHTSARKYAENGWWRTTWQHLRMTREQAARFSRKAHSQHADKRS